MKIPIFQIKINDGRREADPEAVYTLADSISKLGLLNPITVDQEYTLIAGLHRLEAAKRLGWEEIECNVSGLDGLLAELAEIDENFARKDLSAAEFRGLLLRRKEIYENLHPETKAGIAQAVGMNRAMGNNVAAPSAATLKTFVNDTADKLGVAPRTVREELQIAKNLTPEAQEIIQTSGSKIKKRDTIKLSRLAPEQQSEAASRLVSGDIHSMNEYQPSPAEPDGTEEQPQEMPLESEPPAPPPEAPKLASAPEDHCPSIQELAADLKNPDKDRRCTPDSFLVTFSYFLQRFCQSMENYTGPEYDAVLPVLTREHLDQIHQKVQFVHDALDEMYHKIERMAQNEAT